MIIMSMPSSPRTGAAGTFKLLKLNKVLNNNNNDNDNNDISIIIILLVMIMIIIKLILIICMALTFSSDVQI